MNIIESVSAGCGEGKTYAASHCIKDSLQKSNYLYVAPTVKLLQQTKAQLEAIGVNCIEIHSEVVDNPVGKIIGFLKSCESSGHVLLITWAAYTGLTYFHSRKNWKVIIDEIPQLDTLHTYRVPYTSNLLTEHLEVAESINETMGRIVPKDRNSLRAFLQDRVTRDQTYAQFEYLFRDILSEDKDVFVDLKSWASICEVGKVGERDEENTVYFISMLNPRLFRGATLLGANIEGSMFHLWMSQYHGVDFRPNEEITARLRGYSPDGERLRVNYFISGKSWSKELRDKEIDGEPVVDKVERVLAKELGDEPFLLIANNDHMSSLEQLPNCKRIGVDSKGMNQYQDYTKIVHIPALNRQPKHNWMLRQMGIDDATIRRSTSQEVLYQNIMRTALRNPDSNEVVDLYVPSEFDADYLICLFANGVQKKHIGDIEFKKFVPLSRNQRNNNSKANKAMREALDRKIELPDFDDQLSIDVNKESHHFSAIGEDGTPQPDYLLNICKDELSTKEEEFSLVPFFGISELCSFFRDLSKMTVDGKNDVWMFNPVLYQKDEKENYRRQKNFLLSTMMVLDFDNGDVSPDDFKRIFWDEAGRANKRSFIMMNSFSRSEAQPNRFRVVMPYKKPAVNYQEHLAIFNSIVARLEQHGFSFEKSGLDRTCANGTQPFLLPCTNREHQDWHLFNAVGVQKREIERHAIDPSTYLKTVLAKSESNIVVPIDRVRLKRCGTDSGVVERVAEIETGVTSLSEGRRSAIHTAGWAMAGLGLGLDEIEERLTKLAHETGNSKKNWVTETMKSLRTKGRVAA